MKNKIIISLLSVAAFINVNFISKSSSSTVTKNDRPSADSIIWSFSPTQANPQFGSSRALLPTDYSINYAAGKINSYLPYYGRAYSGADVFADRSPLYFTSSDFTIETKEGKKGSKELTIIFKDQREISKMYFTFYDNGSANLSVNLTNRSAISFVGRVDPPNKNAAAAQ